VTVVPLAPDIVVENRLLARSTLHQTPQRYGGVVIADLSEVAYIDASGLGALVAARDRLRPVGGELDLAAVNEDASVLFKIAKFDTVVWAVKL
jgi:anti-anti-sigma factor